MESGQDLSIPILLSVISLLLGLGGLVRGLQMRFGGRIDLVADLDYRPLPNPSAHLEKFSAIYIAFGAMLLALPTLILLGIPTLIFGLILATIVWVWFEAIDRISGQARNSRSGPRVD